MLTTVGVNVILPSRHHLPGPISLAPLVNPHIDPTPSEYNAYDILFVVLLACVCNDIALNLPVW